MQLVFDRAWPGKQILDAFAACFPTAQNGSQEAWQLTGQPGNVEYYATNGRMERRLYRSWSAHPIVKVSLVAGPDTRMQSWVPDPRWGNITGITLEALTDLRMYHVVELALEGADPAHEARRPQSELALLDQLIGRFYEHLQAGAISAAA
jgi:hypothetical protein